MSDDDDEDNVDADEEQLLQIIGTLDLSDSSEFPKISTVRCTAHTLQLAVRDACNDLEDVLDLVRRVARTTLRTPNNALRLKENNLP